MPDRSTAIYSLRRPVTAEQWQNYHDIRRRVLWENRGRFGVYDEHHPDEHKTGHFPLLLYLESEPIGVVRIDVDGERAILRRVAIRGAWQGFGHGTQMMQLAEEFARARGCRQLYSHVDPDAVGFYERCGFRRDAGHTEADGHVAMQRSL